PAKRVGDLGTSSPAACAAIQFTPGIIDNARHSREEKKGLSATKQVPDRMQNTRRTPKPRLIEDLAARGLWCTQSDGSILWGAFVSCPIQSKRKYIAASADSKEIRLPRLQADPPSSIHQIRSSKALKMLRNQPIPRWRYPLLSMFG
ncbi:hypothetical protein PspLS_02322, partial [Pyricularia sp. CBS 133598]